MSLFNLHTTSISSLFCLELTFTLLLYRTLESVSKMWAPLERVGSSQTATNSPTSKWLAWICAGLTLQTLVDGAVIRHGSGVVAQETTATIATAATEATRVTTVALSDAEDKRFDGWMVQHMQQLECMRANNRCLRLLTNGTAMEDEKTTCNQIYYFCRDLVSVEGVDGPFFEEADNGPWQQPSLPGISTDNSTDNDTVSTNSQSAMSVAGGGQSPNSKMAHFVGMCSESMAKCAERRSSSTLSDEDAQLCPMIRMLCETMLSGEATQTVTVHEMPQRAPVAPGSSREEGMEQRCRFMGSTCGHMLKLSGAAVSDQRVCDAMSAACDEYYSRVKQLAAEAETSDAETGDAETVEADTNELAERSLGKRNNNLPRPMDLVTPGPVIPECLSQPKSGRPSKLRTSSKDCCRRPKANNKGRKMEYQPLNCKTDDAETQWGECCDADGDRKQWRQCCNAEDDGKQWGRCCNTDDDRKQQQRCCNTDGDRKEWRKCDCEGEGDDE